MTDYDGDRETGEIGSVSHLRGLDAKKLARYRGWSTGGIADTFMLGKYVRRHSEEAEPAAPEISVMLDPNVETISNARAEELVEAWRGHGREVTLYRLPSTPKLEHDVIDRASRGRAPVRVPARAGAPRGNDS